LGVHPNIQPARHSEHRPAVDTWLAQGCKRPLANYVQDAFTTLKAEV
jgi:hypothetical protein